jgi:hypothetical protein
LQSHEIIARFVFLDSHVGKNGQVRPNTFSQVNTVGCSIQRDSIAPTDEIRLFVRNFIRKNPGRTLQGVITAGCGALRSIRIDGIDGRTICLYDTALPENPAHGEIFGARPLEPEDWAELRGALFDAFGGGPMTTPTEYRDGTFEGGQ